MKIRIQKRRNGLYIALLPWAILAVSIGLVFTLDSLPQKQISEAPTYQPTTVIHPQSTIDPRSSPTTPQLNANPPVNMSPYSLVSPEELHKKDDGKIEYVFESFEPEKDYEKSFTVSFPDTWKAYVFTGTNKENELTYGRSLVLAKGDALIRFTQQLWETGSCVFKQAEVYGMQSLCDQVHTFKNPISDFVVYSVPKTDSDYYYTEWSNFAVCKKEDRPYGLIQGDRPVGTPVHTCNPWTDVGEIDYFYYTKNDKDYQEFIDIVQSVQVHLN